VQERLVGAALAAPRRPAAMPAEAPDGLTAREVEVLQLIAAGLSNKEIEVRLYLSNATVKTHVNRIFAKTGARDRDQAVRYAFEHGLVSAPGSPEGRPLPRPRDVERTQ
jgi:DNA-binding NarL/FixJ family response regulator